MPGNRSVYSRTVARIEPNLAAVLDDLKPKAIPLGFVQPVVALAEGERLQRGKGDG